MDRLTDSVFAKAERLTFPPIELAQRYRPKDDWTGKSDPKERRKLQNRVNQRLWRTRHGLDVAKPRQKRAKRKPNCEPEQGLTVFSSSGTSTSGSSTASTVSPELPGVVPTVADGEIADLGLNSIQTQRVQSLPTMCNLSPTQRQQLILSFNRRMRDSATGSPRLDMLLTLVHFNVFRALFNNTLSMGFDEGWLTGDAISPYFLDGSSSIVQHCPPHLRPTVLQHTVEHHPWIDLFPFPAMRNNLLAADGEYDEDMLCMDLVEFCHVPSEQTGLIVWGEPGDPRGWEVSEAFLAKWAWILQGCGELLESTNHWREQRGEPSLVWEL